MKINGRTIGEGASVYVIAEMSANHGHSLDQALKIVQAAKAAGADAIKLQTFTPDTMTLDSPQKHFKVGGGTLWDGRSLYDLYKEAFMPWEWQPKLKAAANSLGLDLFSSPFDSTSVDFLEGMGVPAYKVASFEIVDIPLIEKIARTGKPMILSTGMASPAEIQEAVDAARGAGATDIVLLKCTSAYPAPFEEMNLNTIRHMRTTFALPIGLSDHTMGITAPIAAVALGAVVIEKHFTLSRSLPGPDSTFSLEPAEFKAMVEGVRITEKVLGKVEYGVGLEQEKSLAFRRSLFVVKDMKRGETFSEQNVRALRPGLGLPPKYLKAILGKQAATDLKRGTPLTDEEIEQPTQRASAARRKA